MQGPIKKGCHVPGTMINPQLCIWGPKKNQKKKIRFKSNISIITLSAPIIGIRFQTSFKNPTLCGLQEIRLKKIKTDWNKRIGKDISIEISNKSCCSHIYITKTDFKTKIKIMIKVQFTRKMSFKFVPCYLIT